MQSKPRIFKEGWMFFLVAVFDAGLTYVLIRYHSYEEKNFFLVWMYHHLLDDSLVSLLVLKVVLSFFLTVIICWMGRKDELLVRNFLKVLSIIYFLSLILIMVLLPRLVNLFILLRLKL